MNIWRVVDDAPVVSAGSVARKILAEDKKEIRHVLAVGAGIKYLISSV